ncbi:MAG: DUF5927 domain-containing protein [Limimaricola soesokkakensis]|uniref:DUF5927 domain-containing protein n=1 Tax=Limimaricola soesokkakensis TaxID=1343159 RepID=UPI004059CE1B
MSFGVVILVHNALDRAAQVIRRWASAGCPVVVHVDRAVRRARFERFRADLDDLSDQVLFCARHRCEWGGWGIVAASQTGAELLLERFPDLGHVYLASGSCVPLRPVAELDAYLAARPCTDFIESARVTQVPWTVGGLSEERFTLRFPFSWKRRRWLFDRYVALQRRLGVRRSLPAGFEPYMGSQWWCLSAATLRAILSDPQRPEIDRYFRRVWIPDESYFQSLARRWSTHIESRSLTMCKFDFQGKPHLFYDDHLPLLRRSGCFVARKIWPRAQAIYDEMAAGGHPAGEAAPSPARIDRVFAEATERRVRGRSGLYMQSRLPNPGWENGFTAAPYGVLEGFAELHEGFSEWFARASGATVHGHIFAPERVEFAGGATVWRGAMSDSAALRDHQGPRFLTNLIWNGRGARQVFQFGPRDSQRASWDIAKDPNARIGVISGAWAVPLFRSGRPAARLCDLAARLQQVEADHLVALRSPQAKARIRVWTLAEFLEAPAEALALMLSDIAPGRAGPPPAPPAMVPLDGLGRFLQEMRNLGMHPYLTGDIPIEPPAPRRPAPRPYLVRPHA